jgi:type IV pilus assembly protein PilC
MSTITSSIKKDLSSSQKIGISLFKNHISRMVIRNFTRDLSVMLSARISLTEGLDILFCQNTNPAFHRVLDRIILHLKSGVPFYRCLEFFPHLFGNLYISLVRVGEITGKLGEMLARISDYLEKAAELRKKFLQAMIYPFMVMGVAFLSAGFLLFYVLPSFSAIFNNFEAELPLVTRVILRISDFCRENLLILTVVLLVFYVMILRARRSASFRWYGDLIIFQIPLLGNLIRKRSISETCRILGTLLNSGISLLRAVDVTACACSNVRVKQELLLMKDLASRGEQLNRSFQNSRLFPLMVVQMITIGEETGNLSLMLLKIADYYEREIEGLTETISSVIEPVVIIVLGLIIGIILIAIYLPLFNMTGILGN